MRSGKTTTAVTSRKLAQSLNLTGMEACCSSFLGHVERAAKGEKGETPWKALRAALQSVYAGGSGENLMALAWPPPAELPKIFWSFLMNALVHRPFIGQEPFKEVDLSSLRFKILELAFCRRATARSEISYSKLRKEN